MKLPKLPTQWAKLDKLGHQRIDEVTDLSAQFLTQAGYNADSLDENGDPITDDVQSLLMDAMLRAPHLYLHISKLVELTKDYPSQLNVVEFDAPTMPAPEQAFDLESAARQEFVDWAAGASDSDLDAQLAASAAAIAAGEQGVAADELAIVQAEIAKRHNKEN